jgi:hypothetical protein
MPSTASTSTSVHRRRSPSQSRVPGSARVRTGYGTCLLYSRAGPQQSRGIAVHSACGFRDSAFRCTLERADPAVKTGDPRRLSRTRILLFRRIAGVPWTHAYAQDGNIRLKFDDRPVGPRRVTSRRPAFRGHAERRIFARALPRLRAGSEAQNSRLWSPGGLSRCRCEPGFHGSRRWLSVSGRPAFLVVG